MAFILEGADTPYFRIPFTVYWVSKYYGLLCLCRKKFSPDLGAYYWEIV